ncbi:hypothetical protein Baya_6379 [Bagarius yarrelli]|uniref:Uncharacterized protein n=1 Tax=Bagarius yarrelli TaxID=175774 RepID=A0A556TY49_BAGYA|nr:hypothetical protein Baya_6379 [Bagarius yarrelli]
MSESFGQGLQYRSMSQLCVSGAAFQETCSLSQDIQDTSLGSGTTRQGLTMDKVSVQAGMDFLRSKLEGSLDALMKTKQELESLLPVEGNSELRSFLLMGPADLHKELKRHKELCES